MINDEKNKELDSVSPDSTVENSAAHPQYNPDTSPSPTPPNAAEQDPAPAGSDAAPAVEGEGARSVYSISGQNIIDMRYSPRNVSGREGAPLPHDLPSGSAASPQTGPRPAGQKKRLGKRAGFIAAIVAAALLLSVLSALGGAMIARSLDNPTIDQTQPEGSDQNTDLPQTPSEGTPNGEDLEDNTVIIIKNNNSSTVETVTGCVGDDNLKLTDVVELVKDTVVEIFTETSVYSGRYVTSGAGSGVIIGVKKDGRSYYIVTNHHVIENSDKITVRLTNGKEYPAALKGTDAQTDIAVIAITVDESLNKASLGSSGRLKVGEAVISIGNPLGELGGTVTDGIISALSREVEIDGNEMTLLQTSAAVNPGNSGGGLFNMRGELVGIVNAKSSGSNVDNIGFAIPIDTAFAIINELIEHGYVTGRIDTGLTLVDITTDIDVLINKVEGKGVYVKQSLYSDEIKYRDRILSVNGTAVLSSEGFKKLISGYALGETVTIKVSRDGKQIDASLTLREYKPAGLSSD